MPLPCKGPPIQRHFGCAAKLVLTSGIGLSGIGLSGIGQVGSAALLSSCSHAIMRCAVVLIVGSGGDSRDDQHVADLFKAKLAPYLSYAPLAYVRTYVRTYVRVRTGWRVIVLRAMRRAHGDPDACRAEPEERSHTCSIGHNTQRGTSRAYMRTLAHSLLACHDRRMDKGCFVQAHMQRPRLSQL